jgi:hypothetical protein
VNLIDRVDAAKRELANYQAVLDALVCGDQTDDRVQQMSRYVLLVAGLRAVADALQDALNAEAWRLDRSLDAL